MAFDFRSMGASEQGFVVFGTDDPSCPYWSYGCGVVPTPFFSTDGREWQAAVVADGVFRHAHIERVIGFEGGFVAVGVTFRMPSGREAVDAEAALWTSPDGRSWSKATLAQPDAGSVWKVYEGDGLFAGGAYDVAAVGNVRVAIGDYMTRRGSSGYRREPRLWRSSNGADWEAGQLPEGYGRELAWPLTGGARFLLAQGDRLWTSPDGEAWTIVELPVPNISFIMRAISRGGGYILYAIDTADRWHLLASADGFSWSEVGQVAADFTSLLSIASAGDLLVTTSESTGSTDPVSGVVASRDGVQWSDPQTGPFVGSSLYEIVANDQTVLVAGETTDGQQVLWVASLD